MCRKKFGSRFANKYFTTKMILNKDFCMTKLYKLARDDTIFPEKIKTFIMNCNQHQIVQKAWTNKGRTKWTQRLPEFKPKLKRFWITPSSMQIPLETIFGHKLCFCRKSLHMRDTNMYMLNDFQNLCGIF